MGNHDIPCDICDIDTRLYTGHDEMSHTADDIRARIAQVEDWPPSSRKDRKLKDLRAYLERKIK
jgi:hypothetical protein